jgi:hypothetical protein
MTRLATAFLMVGFLGMTALAQGTQTPTTPRRIVPPVRGEAQIEILKPATTVVGSEVVTKLKIRNIATGSIALLSVADTWYDREGNVLPGDAQKYRKPFLPGEVIEMELRTPKNPKMFQNTLQFSHANGKIKVTTVKSFPTPTPVPAK